MIKTTQITQAPPTFVLNTPPKEWYDHSLVGVMVGFILGFGANLLKEFLQNRSKRKAIVSNLYNEIGINYTKAGTVIPETEDIRNRFQYISSTVPQGVPSDTPRLEYHGVENNDFYKLYFKDLDLLDQKLQERITQFYSILKSIDARSKTIAAMFKDYYSGNNVVKSSDILSQLPKLINQYKSVEIIGAESIAMMSYLYKKREFGNKEEINKFSREIEKFIKSVGVENKFELRDMCSATNIGLPTGAYILLTLDQVKNETFGKYKVVSI